MTQIPQPTPTSEPTQDFLSRVRVASPCSESWDAMPGGEQIRSCDRCQHKVYNLSAMTAEEATRLVQETEGRLCVRFYRRADGTMMTRDCPVGLRAVRQRVARAVSAAFASVAVLGGASLANRPREEQPRLIQWVLNRIDPQEEEAPLPPTPVYRPLMGAVALPMAPPPVPEPPRAVMGDIEVAPPPQKVMGKIAITHRAPQQESPRASGKK